MRDFVAPSASPVSGGTSFGQEFTQEKEETEKSEEDNNPSSDVPKNPSPSEDGDEEVWDIPAFLRQKN